MTLDDIFNAARDAARHPGEAMAIDDLRRELQGVLDACKACDVEPDELHVYLDDLKALREHVKVQPFDVTEADDYVDVPIVTETTRGSFTDWLATLERLAQ